MIRVCLYARFSTDLQNDKSNDDQHREGRAYAAKQPDDWVVTHVEQDAAKSGATIHQRPGLQNVMRWAEAGEFDVLWTESPDRLARKMAGMAELYDRLKFAGRRWHTGTRGEMDDMKLAFSGYESQSYLTDLAVRTRRGLLGCVADGRSCGARPYGYDFDRDTRMVPDKHRPGKFVPQAGVLKRNDERLAHVLRAMQMFDGGFSPDALAKLFNDERIPSPSGGPWRATTLRGDAICPRSQENAEIWTAGRS